MVEVAGKILAVSVSSAIRVWVASTLIWSDNSLVAGALGLAVMLTVGVEGVQAPKETPKMSASRGMDCFQAMVPHP